MKRILMIPAIMLLLVLTAKAQVSQNHSDDTLRQTRKEKRLSKDKQAVQSNTDHMQQQLAKEFGAISKVKWERIAGYNWAYFTRGGQDLTAIYDDDGNRVGTISHKVFADLPGMAQQHINDHYAGYEKGDIILYDDNEFNKSDFRLYDQQFDEADNYFVTLQKGNKKLILKVNLQGDVAFFTEL